MNLLTPIPEMNLVPHYDERLCGATTQSTSGNLIRMFSKKKKHYIEKIFGLL